MGKFENYLTTAQGDNRAYVDMPKLNTLWLNTGTLCTAAHRVSKHGYGSADGLHDLGEAATGSLAVGGAN